MPASDLYSDRDHIHDRTFKANPILVIEDDPMMVTSIMLFVRDMFPSHFVKIVSTEREFDELFSDARPQFEALIIDPGLDPEDDTEKRLETARRARKLLTPRAPSLVMTGMEVVEEEEAYLNMGYDLYVKKRLIVAAELVSFFNEKRLVENPKQEIKYRYCIPDSRLTFLTDLQDRCFRAWVKNPLIKTRVILNELGIGSQNYHVTIKAARRALEKSLDD
jgi:CheY-like chemotaxis protein